MSNLWHEWKAFRRPGRLIALAAAAAGVITLGVLTTSGVHMDCAGPCPTTPVAADGSTVSDRFWFLHRDLGREGTITVRLTSMTGTITYPPPNHDQIVPGLVPWAKTGIIVKDGLRPGSAYAALAMTGGHGVRLQYDYEHDVGGHSGGVSEQTPRWLRLTRSGDTITAFESPDGTQWDTVGTAKLDALPDVVQVGLFTTSPGDLTLRTTGLGGAIEEVRFTQAVGVFDNVTVVGGAEGPWRSDPVGEMNRTDWEKYHQASGAVEKDGVVTVSGTGDIGPLGENGFGLDLRLPGLVVGVIIVIVVGARFGASTAASASVDRSKIGARAFVTGAAAFLTGVVALGVVLPVGDAILKDAGMTTSTPALTTIRIVLGLGLAMGLSAVLAFGLGVRLRRGWAAMLLGLALIALPYTVATLPLLPDAVSGWLLRVTPAAGFAVQQTTIEYAQVTAHYAPSNGYFPLPWPAGLAVLCAYALAALWLAVGRKPVSPADWR